MIEVLVSDDTHHTSTPRGVHAARGDLVIIWALVMVGIVAVMISAGYVFNENLYAYGLCSTPPHTGCSDAPWFSSMSLSFFGGIAAVGVGHRCRDREDSDERGGEIVVLFTVPRAVDRFAEPRHVGSLHGGATAYPTRPRGRHEASAAALDTRLVVEQDDR